MSLSSRHTVQVAIAGLILTALFAYGAFQARALLQGPEIAITSPTSGATVNAAMVRVTGNTSRISSIKLNDRSISITESGQFREPVTLSPGPNVITLEATDRFGRETERTLQVVHRPLQTGGDSLTQTERDDENTES